MSAAVFLRKVVDFLDTHPAETAAFAVEVEDAEVSFHGSEATVAQVDDLLTSIGGGLWRHTVQFGWTGYITAGDTPLGEVTIYAPIDVLAEVFAALPKTWVQS